jgi:membrane protein
VALVIGELLSEARAMSPREAMREIVRGFRENDLMTYASAITFRVSFAIIPLALMTLGLLGAFGLTKVWSDELAPRVQEQTSGPAFEVIDQTVRQALEQKQLFWVTIGAVIAIWAVGGAMRTIMLVLSRIYEDDDDRTSKERSITSLWLATLATVLLLAAVASITVLPDLLGGGALAGALGWVLGVVLLFATVGSIVRFAPKRSRPLRWVSFGSVLVIVGWIAASLVFAWYINSLVDPGSVFGGLSVAMIALAYLYLSVIVFLTGLQLDSLIRRQLEPPEVPEPGEPSEIIVAKSLASVEN